MRLWSELSERFHALFSRTREDRELDEELSGRIAPCESDAAGRCWCWDICHEHAVVRP